MAYGLLRIKGLSMTESVQPTVSVSGQASGRVRRAWRWAVNMVLPAQCLGCRTVVDTLGALCPSCWSKVRFIDRPLCAACGVPFEFEMGEGALCGACVRSRPEYDRARAAIVYDEGSRGLILGLKHGDRTDAAPAFARWMLRAGGELVADADLIAPVPLHWTRLFARRYNQAALLALAIGKQSGTRVVPDLLVRRKRTSPLGKLGPSARRKTVQHAFTIRARKIPIVSGRRVLLIDDVHTTGATVNGCSRVLLRAGASAVDVLSVARTVRPAY
jgi:ComF family protein